jgi:hypothetical protein
VPTNLTYTPSGLVNNDTASILSGSLGTAATASSPVGNYAFTLASLSAGANYTLVLAANAPTFAVTKATLIITANNTTKIQGEANPTFTVNYSGFAPGDGPSVLGGTLTFSTPATTSSPPGPYTITPSGLTSNNYAIQYKSGTLTVLSYSQATSDLKAQVDRAGLARGIRNALDAMLGVANILFQQSDTSDAVAVLRAFIKLVSAQKGKLINATLANALIAYAQRIINAVG